jgi:gamma-glutamylcyclotransferase (GGCT)/AIG2-like uncharacterized protein YtfP
VADHLFVYGTLRHDTGHPAAGLLERRARAVGFGLLRGRLYDLGAYPAAVRSAEPEHRVRGIVYRLEPGLREVLLTDLDAYEGAEYRRELAAVRLESGETVSAWVYLYARTPPPGRVIAGGDYRRRDVRLPER